MAARSEDTNTTPSAGLEALLERLAPVLIRYGVAKSAGDRQTAEDVAQEALTALVIRYQRADPPRNPEAFCFAIARRRLARRAVRARLLAPLTAVARQPAPDDCRPDDRLARRQVVEERLEKLAELPRRDREALLLVVAAGLDLDSAAEALGTTPGALKTRLHRARRRLRGGDRRAERTSSYAPQRSTK